MPQYRLKENRRLPKRWTQKHGAFYYLVPPNEREHWDGKSWFPLGKSLADAHRTFSERIYKKGAVIITMQDLLDRFEFERMPQLAPATQKYYLYALPMVRSAFTATRFPVAVVEPSHAYAMTDHLAKTQSTKKAKQAAECLSSALSYAVRLGVIKANPLIGQFKKPSTPGRNREVTDDELMAFATLLPRKWQLYLSLKLHTHGRRKAELLRIRRSHLTAPGIQFINNKRQTDRFTVKWTPTLRQIITEIIEVQKPPKGNAMGDDPYLFYARLGQAYIAEDGQTSGFDSVWQRYMTKAVKAGLCEKFTEHDIRAKAVESETLEVASRLLRHTSTQVTQKHYRRKPEEL
jgi:integrase